MGRERVVVVDSDEWVVRLLASGLGDHGFEVSTACDGPTALKLARSVQPRCIVTEVELPELDGPSLVRMVRNDDSEVSKAAVVFLCEADDALSRFTAFQAGGDVYLTKPFRVEEIALQVQALVSMSARIRRGAEYIEIVEVEPPPDSVVPGGHAFEGNIADMSIATILTLLEMEHRSGIVKFSNESYRCSLELVGGYVTSGTVGGSIVAPLAVLREVLRWRQGRFRFRPVASNDAPMSRRSVGALLLEAVRLDDEACARRSGIDIQEAPPSSAAVLPASIGTSKRSVPPGRPFRPPQPSQRPPAPRPSTATGRRIGPPPLPCSLKKPSL